MFKSEAMFRKHQQQAHRSISGDDLTNFVADTTVAAATLDGGQEKRVPPLNNHAMATYYSCTVCKMIFSSVGEIQGGNSIDSVHFSGRYWGLFSGLLSGYHLIGNFEVKFGVIFGLILVVCTYFYHRRSRMVNKWFVASRKFLGAEDPVVTLSTVVTILGTEDWPLFCSQIFGCGGSILMSTV